MHIGMAPGFVYRSMAAIQDATLLSGHCVHLPRARWIIRTWLQKWVPCRGKGISGVVLTRIHVISVVFELVGFRTANPDIKIWKETQADQDAAVEMLALRSESSCLYESLCNCRAAVLEFQTLGQRIGSRLPRCESSSTHGALSARPSVVLKLMMRRMVSFRPTRSCVQGSSDRASAGCDMECSLDDIWRGWCVLCERIFRSNLGLLKGKNNMFSGFYSCGQVVAGFCADKVVSRKGTNKYHHDENFKVQICLQQWVYSILALKAVPA